MGTLDKAVRVLIALAIAVMYFLQMISGWLAIVLLLFAGIFIVTSFISFCPLYLPFGISTRPKNR
ncbi:MAG: DUF2892 domain-containing protein [Sphingobacteriia bacterium]|nr:MAG: DUF2892 domain-containing protein [Sphingobacteriia bacterium]